MILSGVIGFGLIHTLPSGALQAWGWRVPFFIGLSIVPVGMYIRSKLSETLAEEQRYHSNRQLYRELFTTYLFPLTMCVLIIGGIAVNQYFFSYMTTYALMTLKLPAQVAMLAPIVSGVTGAIFAMTGGYIADRFGRKMINVLPRIALMLLAYPLFSYVTAHPGAGVFLFSIMCLVALNLLCYSTAALVAVECFPRAVRATGYSIGYAIGVTLFGGTGQVVFTWLIYATGSPASPILYVILRTGLTMFAVLGALRHVQKHASIAPRAAFPA